MKLLILNSTIDPRPYFKAKGFDFEVDYKTLDVTPPLINTGTFTGGTLWSPDIVEYVRGIIEPNQYNFVIWCYPAEHYPTQTTTGGKSFGFPHVYLGTHLATVRLDGNEEHYMVHELHHLFFYHLSKLGYPVIDEMDNTHVNGQVIPYYKDQDRDAPDSNHSRTWASIEPYKAHLSDFAPIMKKGLKNPWVALLQGRMGYPMYPLLSSDGSFGTYTEKCVKDFQKKHGLIADGIVGPKVISALESKKKALIQTEMDLSNWKLIPELEEKAIQFLTIAKEKGFDIRITQGFRDPATQDALYAQGRTAPGKIVTRATSKKSYHCKGQAFDICFNGKTAYPTDDTKWQVLADIGQSLGLTAGYYFKGFQDKPHFELK